LSLTARISTNTVRLRKSHRQPESRGSAVFTPLPVRLDHSSASRRAVVHAGGPQQTRASQTLHRIAQKGTGANVKTTQARAAIPRGYSIPLSPPPTFRASRGRFRGNSTHYRQFSFSRAKARCTFSLSKRWRDGNTDAGRARLLMNGLSIAPANQAPEAEHATAKEKDFLMPPLPNFCEHPLRHIRQLSASADMATLR